MTLSAAPPPPNRHPPFVDDIRGWDEFFLNSPRFTPLNRRDFGFDISVPPKSHEQKQPFLAPTPEIFFSCARSPPFLASSRETLETSLVFPTTTTNLRGIRNEEETEPEDHQRCQDRREEVLPTSPPKKPQNQRGNVAHAQAVGRCPNESAIFESKVQILLPGQIYPLDHHRRPILQGDGRGIPVRADPRGIFVGASLPRKKGACRFGRRRRVDALRPKDQRSRNKSRCIARPPPPPPSPPVSIQVEGVPPDPRDIYGVYPIDFARMVDGDAAAKEEVSTSKRAPMRTRSRSRSRSATRGRGRIPAPSEPLSTPKAAASILDILNSTAKATRTTTPATPPTFSEVLARPKSPPTVPTLASAIEGMEAAVKRHQTDSLSLLHSSAGPGKDFERRLTLLRKGNISHLVGASARVKAAGGTTFSLENLFEIARSEEKEARRRYASAGSTNSEATNALTIHSSITDTDGFTTVRARSGKSSSPPKQRLQSRSPPRPDFGTERVNQFDEIFLNSFKAPDGTRIDTNAPTEMDVRKINDQRIPVSSSLPSSSIVYNTLSPPPPWYRK